MGMNKKKKKKRIIKLLKKDNTYVRIENTAKKKNN